MSFQAIATPHGGPALSGSAVTLSSLTVQNSDEISLVTTGSFATFGDVGLLVISGLKAAVGIPDGIYPYKKVTSTNVVLRLPFPSKYDGAHAVSTVVVTNTAQSAPQHNITAATVVSNKATITIDAAADEPWETRCFLKVAGLGASAAAIADGTYPCTYVGGGKYEVAASATDGTHSGLSGTGDGPARNSASSVNEAAAKHVASTPGYPYGVVPDHGSLAASAHFWVSGGEASGNMIDASGKGRDLLESSAPGTRTVGGFKGRDFDGTDDYFHLSLTDPAPDLSKKWYFCAHVYLDAAPASKWPIFSLGESNPDDERAIHLRVESDLTLRLQLSKDGTATGQLVLDHTTALSATTWTFIEAYFDRDNSRAGVAINGALFETATWANDIYKPPGHVPEIGRVEFLPIDFANGVMRHIGLFSKLPDNAERAVLYGAGTPAGWPLEI